MISIIIPSSNGKHLLKDCLPAVMRLRKVTFEVIVVDNGSSDGTVDYINERFPSVRVIEYPEALGFSRAVNAGIQAAQGEYVALLNNDTQVEPEWLYELATALDEHPKVGFCASKILKASNRHLIYAAGDGLTVAGFAYNRGKEDPEEIYYLQPEHVFGACAGAALYRKELFDNVGLFDEDFYAFLEDVDLSFRAQMQGYRCLYVSSARVYHIGGATFGDMAERCLFYGNRNRLYFLAKNMPAWFLVRHSLSILAYSLINILLYTAKGKGMAVAHGYFEGLRTIGPFLEKRKETLAKRTVQINSVDAIMDRNWLTIMARLSRFLKRFYQPVLPPDPLKDVAKRTPSEVSS